MKRWILFLLIIAVMILPVQADSIKWVSFDVPYDSLEYAMQEDIRSYEEDVHISWIVILAVSACKTGGKCTLPSVRSSCKALREGQSPEQILGELYRYYAYYYKAYQAVLGGLLGTYKIKSGDKEIVKYGLKAFSPVAAGYHYTHCADFGNNRSYGFSRKHLGNDIMGALGTPITAVEGGVVEAVGWNQYGGWRIGIRSFDGKRYYYYAHLQKDSPYARDFKAGDVVQAGELLGFMGRTGYSRKENVNNISEVHLHFGMQLIFDESQKDSVNEIWIDVYDIVRLLSSHRSTYRYQGNTWTRQYPYEDLDTPEYPHFGCYTSKTKVQ